MVKFLAFHKRQILDSYKLKEFADNNFELEEKGGKFSKRVENVVGKGEIARFEQFLYFPQCFPKTHKNRACFGKSNVEIGFGE